MNKYTLNKKNRTLLCLLLIEIINSKVCPMTYPPPVRYRKLRRHGILCYLVKVIGTLYVQLIMLIIDII